MEKITLDYPVTVNGQTVSTLCMRRPKVADQLAVDNAGSGALREINLFANLCEQSPELIKELDMFDYGQLQEKYEGFLSRSTKAS